MIVSDVESPSVVAELRYAAPSVSNMPVMCKSSFDVALVFVPVASPICVLPPVPGAMTRSSFVVVVISTGTPSNSSWPA
ncbi:MAG: hypothetical protein Q8R05_07530 [Candidatus Omnitrophota bacterium]|nr:hypothetical protein [Candidatus Omnitrophota bacterium]